MAVTRISAEDVLQKVYDILKANLNTYITTMNSERTGDGNSITLDLIPTGSPSGQNAFFFQDVPPDVNVTPWCLVAINSPVDIEMAGPQFSSRFTMIVIISSSKLLAKMNVDKIHRSFMRYTEAVTRCLADNYQALRGFSVLKITQVPQAAEVELEPGEVIRIAGLQLSAAIA